MSLIIWAWFGPLQSTFVALPPQHAFPIAYPFRFKRLENGSVLVMKFAMFGTYCPA